MSMMMPWLECLQDGFEPIAENDVQTLEIKLGIKLPLAFREFLLLYN
jgi:hypothetical protein